MQVPYTVEDFKRAYILEHVRELPTEEIVGQFTPEERLAGLSDKQIEAYLKKRRKKPTTSKKKKPGSGGSARS